MKYMLQSLIDSPLPKNTGVKEKKKEKSQEPFLDICCAVF